MGRVVVVNFTSIDGVVQSPLSAEEDPSGGFTAGGWVPPYSDATVDAFMQDVTVGAGGLLLGRRSYRILTDAWAQADRSEPAVAAMNRVTKYVVTRSLGPDDLDWAPATVVDDVATGVPTARDEVAGDLVVLGSGELVASLAAHDLVDEYRLLLFPVVLGGGRRMFGDGGPTSRFRLTGSVTSASGVVLLSYARARD